MKTNKKCPLCGLDLLIEQRYPKRNPQVEWCSTQIKFQGGKTKHHYVHNLDMNSFTMIVMPYRIITTLSESIVAVHIPPDSPKANEAYKTGTWLFKTMFRCPPINPMPEDKLLNKIKTLLPFA